MDGRNSTPPQRSRSNKPRWYIARDGERRGPFTDDVILGFVEHDAIDVGDLVWRPGFLNWTEAGHVPGLFIPPPLPEAVAVRSSAVPPPVDAPAPGETSQSRTTVAEGEPSAGARASVLPSDAGDEERMRTLRAKLINAAERQQR